MEPMQNQHLSEIVIIYQISIDRLKACGIDPKHHVLDNECCEESKEAIKMTYQLMQHDDHQQNIAERTIQTAKSHIISVLCGFDPNFPISLWNLQKKTTHILPPLPAKPPKTSTS